MSISYWLDRSSAQSKQSYDVIIIGAGISGLSTAYWLNREDPSIKIGIIEKNRIAFGASGRNAGFITCGSVEHFNRMISKHGLQRALEIWRFAQTNKDLLKEHIIRGEGDSVEFEERGAYSLATQVSEMNELMNVAETMKAQGIPVKIYNENEIEKNVGAIGFVGGIRYMDDGAVNPVKLLNLMKTRINAEVIENAEVYSVEDTGSDTRVVKTDVMTAEAPVVIYSLNGYSAAVNPYFADKIYATKGQILMMESVPQFMDGPCYANFYLDYFRQLPSGELLIGGFRQLEKETEVGYSDHTTPKIQEALHSFIQKHLPQYRDKKVTHRWGGIMGFSRDGEPMVGTLPHDPQIFFNGGYTGHGMGLAFHTAKTTVDLMFGRPIPEWLSARRFGS